MGIANLRVVVDNTQKELDEKNKWVVTRHDIFDGRAEIHQIVNLRDFTTRGGQSSIGTRGVRGATDKFSQKSLFFIMEKSAFQTRQPSPSRRKR